ncbi:MAG: hypothetical protein KA792_08325 [Bacteroidales bacterium]|nr:hypothetical protein [Bacteroidales bacterium]
MINYLKKDSFIFGLILGIVCPVVAFFIIYFITYLLEIYLGSPIITVKYLYKVSLLSLCLNLIFLRYYLKNMQFEKTGRGIMLITFIMVLTYFYFEFLG